MTEEETGSYAHRVGENIAQLRRARGMTQAELAERVTDTGLPFHQQTVVKIEKGQRPVRLREADAIATVLDVELDTLVTEAAAVDVATELISAIRRVETAWTHLREMNQEFLRAGVMLRHQLELARQQDLDLPSFVAPSLKLLALDPVKIAKEAQVRHEAEIEQVVKHMDALEGAVSVGTPWEDGRDG